MKLLVTGGAGFIGSNFICEALKQEGLSILAIDKLTYAANLASLKTVKSEPRFSFLELDLCETKSLIQAIKNFSPDRIIHFAAETHVDRSIDSPEPFIASNLVATGSLLEAVRSYLESAGSQKKSEFVFIHVSTDEVYGPAAEGISFKENDVYNPSSPYAATKAGADHLVNAWSRTYGVSSIITYCTNNFGQHQFPEKLIPLAILNAIDGKEIPLYGSGEQRRNWIHVRDHVSALLAVLREGKAGEKYHISSDEERSNLEVVRQICQLLNARLGLWEGKKRESLINHIADRKGHDIRYSLNCDKIRSDLKWKPELTFDRGLELTVDWYLTHYDSWKTGLNE